MRNSNSKQPKQYQLEVSEKQHFANMATETIESLENEGLNSLAAELHFLAIYEYIFSRYNEKRGRRLKKIQEFFSLFTEEQITKYQLINAHKETKEYFLDQYWPDSIYNKNADY